jgi:hypothetical protein
MRSICSDGAKVGANFEHGAGEKVTIALFSGVLVMVVLVRPDGFGF